MSKKTVIIGGVAGGATTATRLRRRDESMEIVILERGEYISYANCGLPYHVGDVIKERDSLLVMTPQAMKKKFNIDVRVRNEVVMIMPEEKKVLVRNHETGADYTESYDDLVIATGSSPVIPPIEGIDGEDIFTLWTVPDTDKIRGFIEERKPSKAAVIGGGFIGLEMAENLHAQGLQVSIIEMMDQVMAPLDKEMAELIHENLRMNGVELILGDGVKAFKRNESRTTVELSSGRAEDFDMIILAIGVKPNSQIARDAGLELNAKGGIIVDSHLRTSAPDIYALGDVIEVENFVTKDKTMIPLAGPANKQGRILADIIAGDDKEYKGTLGTAIAKVFDLDAASVGINEKQLKAMGKTMDKDYFVALINQKSHAGYYPGATPMTLKLIFDGEGKIYGAQIVGQDGVDKRIDTIAVTMRLSGTIYDLEELELAYAPPFSSAKDPVNMLGFVAENILRGQAAFISYDKVDEMKESADKCIVLDVTEEVERMVFSVPGSYHIPLGQLRDRMEEMDKDKLIIPYCAIGVRSYNAARALMQKGFKNVKILAGGTSFYKSMHSSFEKAESKSDGSGEDNKMENEKELKVLDCCGLQCPGPIMKVNQAMSEIEEGRVLKVAATDMGFAADIESWCRRTGNTFIKKERVDKENIVYIRKGSASCPAVSQGSQVVETPQGKTIIVFSGDLDKVLASFIIANGAAAMGRPVTMFFTFWGLNALRKSDGKTGGKPFMDKMFGSMMPKGTGKLKLSKMNMGGMGTAMMKKVMKDKNVDSLEELMQHALDSGIKLVACTMSMDIMGIRKEELIDGVELAGVASYLGDAEESNVNLFI